MSERYTRIFEGESDLYAEGSPVMISAAVLLNDTETGRIIAQMKFRSLSEKRITYLKVRVKPFDMLKNALSPVEFEYTDLSADMYDQFGQKTPVVLPDTSARSYEADVIGAAFSDGTVWKNSETEWHPDPERKKRVEALVFNNDTEKAAKKSNKIIAITTPIVVVCIAFLIVLTTVIIPNGKYNDAISLIEKGDIINAYESLIALNGYKDSAEKAKEIFGKYKIEKLKTASVGNIVYFGAYEQDNNTSNGKEDIEWLVLAKEGNKALLISKYALDCQEYNTSYTDTDVTWETCSLRKWLNGTFLSAAFSSEEQSSIISSTVTADKNPSYNTSPGNNTIDKVFLLSITEVNKYFSSDEARKCAPTDYSIAQGAWTSDRGWWWLRSPGGTSDCAASVDCDRSVFIYGHFVFSASGAVRPALWISLGD